MSKKKKESPQNWPMIKTKIKIKAQQRKNVEEDQKKSKSNLTLPKFSPKANKRKHLRRMNKNTKQLLPTLTISALSKELCR